ncbi:hypothetical protein ACJ9N4_20325 [Enterobacter sp. LM3]|uniref:hypothetical protein n=1 Tax=Enterobacter sp. LM3 TaxID=3384450 RepID=UPI0039861219
MNLKNKLWYFWGSMDVLAILLYCVISVRQGRIPFFSDVMAFSGLSNAVSGGGYSVLLTLFFIFDLLLLLSFIVSAWFFFKRKPYAIKFAFIQEIFRFISFRCSVTLFPILVSIFGMSSVFLGGGFFVLSEILKISSLVFLMRKIKRVPVV